MAHYALPPGDADPLSWPHRTLVAQPFDPATLELSGDAAPVAEVVSRNSSEQAVFSVSQTGRLLYQSSLSSEERRLVWFERDGREGGTVGEPAAYRSPVLSHDQRRVAVAIIDPQTQVRDIWVLDIERGGAPARVTFDPVGASRPRWSGDDRRIYFTSFRTGDGDVYSKPSSGTGTAELVYGGREREFLDVLSPDGATGWLVSFNAAARTPPGIHRIDLESLETEAVLQTSFPVINPDISPDGRWLLHQTNSSGRAEVYVQSLLDEGAGWPVSIDGGTRAKWTRGGREIVFQATEGRLMAVEVRLEPTFSVGIPEPLFDPQQAEMRGRQYDVTPDGNRFLVVQPIGQPSVEPLTLVQNWARELER